MFPGITGMRQSRSKCNIFGQARIPGHLPLRKHVGATLCEAVSKLLEFNPFFILFCLSSIYVVKKRVNIDPLLQKIIAKRIDIDPLLQEIIANRVNVDPLLQEITAKRIDVDPF